ncbi:hypothetical protein CVT24_007492, partial [Panaeolus cyanescens]
MPSDVFRPRLPIDPFSTIDKDEPWRVPSQLQSSQPQVILIIGEPTWADLCPLITSRQLSTSLILIATHQPPHIPPLNLPGPSIRILRLLSPLSPHDNGALRLVSLLQHAHSIASLWRFSLSQPSSPLHTRIIQLAQQSPQSEFNIVEEFTSSPSPPPPHQPTHTATPQSYPSPAPSIASSASTHSSFLRIPFFSSRSPSPSTSTSSLRLSSPSPLASTSSLFRLPSSSSSSLSKTQTALRNLIKDQEKSSLLLHLPSSNSNSANAGASGYYRPFDAIINFLPGGVPDKALLKNAILVTTLSAQYLAPPNLEMEQDEDDEVHDEQGDEQGDGEDEEEHKVLVKRQSKRFSSIFMKNIVDHTDQQGARLKKRFSILGTRTTTDTSNPATNPAIASGITPDGDMSSPSQWSAVGSGSLSVPALSSSGSASGSSSSVFVSGSGSGSASSSGSYSGIPSSKRHSHYPPPSKSKPKPKPKLIQSIEQFLLSFAYPLPGSVSVTSLGVGGGAGNGNGNGKRRSGMVGGGSSPASFNTGGGGGGGGGRRGSMLSTTGSQRQLQSINLGDRPLSHLSQGRMDKPHFNANPSHLNQLNKIENSHLNQLGRMENSRLGQLGMIEKARM